MKADQLAGEAITARLTHAPCNQAAIGGLKVTTENGWFAARPSGTENVYKIYAESFISADHLSRIQTEAQEIVDGVLNQLPKPEPDVLSRRTINAKFERFRLPGRRC